MIKIQKVEFTLTNTSERIIVKDIRGIFPKDNVPFTVHTDKGDITTQIKIHDDNLPHFHLGFRPTGAKITTWFSEHPDLKIGDAGDKLTIEVVKPKEEYNLTLKKVPWCRN